MEKLIKKYEELCAIPYVKNGNEPYSDISYHLPKLKEYAEKCSSAVEFGVRRGHSTVALLCAKMIKLTSYDLVRWDDIKEIELLAKDSPTNFMFKQQSSLEADIEETDLIFYDTFHSMEMLKRELAKHASKARKYQIFHDTGSTDGGGFWEHAEPSYEAVAALGVNSLEGLRYAIEPFLETHPEWQVEYRSHVNNGLLILRRVA